ncbi:MAG: hypothetical protein Q7T73_09665 [Beijerinckiaceae bacterium]|jgi:hypothetical protein|nr:hypothetical protein [Beijerinckiaceae bacterium]
MQCNNAIPRCTTEALSMSDNKVEYYAVSTGIVLTAIAALVPFFA